MAIVGFEVHDQDKSTSLFGSLGHGTSLSSGVRLGHSVFIERQVNKYM